MTEDHGYTDEAGIYSKKVIRRGKPGPLSSHISYGLYTKELDLDVLRLIGTKGDRTVYKNCRLSVEWRCLINQKTSGDHKKSTGQLQINYEINSKIRPLASFDVQKGYAKNLLIYSTSLERKIFESTGMDFYKFMKHLYKNNSV